MSDIQLRDGARKALEEHAWQDAYEAFVSLRDGQDLSGEDWQRLGEAAWWSAHPNESSLKGLPHPVRVVSIGWRDT